jgi:hypothetical protein
MGAVRIFPGWEATRTFAYELNCTFKSYVVKGFLSSGFDFLCSLFSLLFHFNFFLNLKEWLDACPPSVAFISDITLTLKDDNAYSHRRQSQCCVRVTTLRKCATNYRVLPSDENDMDSTGKQLG